LVIESDSTAPESALSERLPRPSACIPDHVCPFGHSRVHRNNKIECIRSGGISRNRLARGEPAQFRPAAEKHQEFLVK
jgi:hypothetical protein